MTMVASMPLIVPSSEVYHGKHRQLQRYHRRPLSVPTPATIVSTGPTGTVAIAGSRPAMCDLLLRFSLREKIIIQKLGRCVSSSFFSLFIDIRLSRGPTGAGKVGARYQVMLSMMSFFTQLDFSFNSALGTKRELSNEYRYQDYNSIQRL